VGTQAFREGGNARELVVRIEDESGLRVAIIDSREEAELTRRGIASVMGSGIPANSVIVDIGGGSTEFIRSVRGKTSIISTRLGVIHLDDLFPLKDPPRDWELNNLRFYLRDRIERVRDALGVKGASRIVGTAGTYTTLAAVHKQMRRYVPENINGTSLKMNEMKTLVSPLLSMSSRSRLRLPGMEKGRERLIVPGSLIALESMHIFRAQQTVVSDGSLLEGIIGEMVENESKGENYVVQ
jgi:exopolyphosphatase/guanosine-5'-triphosphate,3'-diphosphate pyrophosphatase